jgi:hypothetical protein
VCSGLRQEGDVNIAKQIADEKEANDYVALLKETRVVSLTIPSSHQVITDVIDTIGIRQLFKSVLWWI